MEDTTTTAYERIIDARQRFKDRRQYMAYLVTVGILTLDTDPVARRKGEHCVYIFQVDDLYKIGRSVDPEWRRRQLQTALAKTIEIVHVIPTRQHGLERALHRKFKDRLVAREWFALTEEDLRWIKEFGTALE
jgi:hypothetical protein